MYICSDCGYGSASWMGKCSNCGAWNTLSRQVLDIGDGAGKSEPTAKLETISLSKIKTDDRNRLKTGSVELDRTLGGGIVAGEVVLITGEPGIGKSTLLLQSFQFLNCLYISGEESASQVAARAARLKSRANNLTFSDVTQVEGIVQGVEKLDQKPELIIIDSIQTIYSPKVASTAGSVAQLRHATSELVQLAKKNKIAIILVGHVTKEGEIAGPKTLEHFVDCVLLFEGEKVSHFRILRCTKNRFGSTDEIGIFEMTEEGLSEVTNPLVFLNQNDESVAGRATCGVIEGKRSLFFEIQTLTVPSVLAVPRRVVRGVNYNKVQLLLAVIQKHLKLPVDRNDVYINVVGGIDIKSTGADLGIVASIISSIKNVPLPTKSVFTGEVGLLGEVRHVYFERKLEAEAKRLKFSPIYSPVQIPNIRKLGVIIGS